MNLGSGKQQAHTDVCTAFTTYNVQKHIDRALRGTLVNLFTRVGDSIGAANTFGFQRYS